MIVWVGLLLATNQKMSDGGGQPPLPPSENPAGKAVPPSENPAGKAVPPPENLAGKAPASPARGRGRPTGSVGPMRRALETAARQPEGGDAERPDEAIDDDMMQDLLTTILHQRGRLRSEEKILTLISCAPLISVNFFGLYAPASEFAFS